MECLAARLGMGLPQMLKPFAVRLDAVAGVWHRFLYYPNERARGYIGVLAARGSVGTVSEEFPVRGIVAAGC